MICLTIISYMCKKNNMAAAAAAAALDVSVQKCIIFDRRGGQPFKYGQLAKREQ